MAWIELHQSVVTHRKTMAFADALDIPEYAAVGLLSCLWLWAVDNAPDGVLPDSPRTIARAIRWDKDPTELIDALVESEYLRRDDGCLIIHDWSDYIGKLIDQRQTNAKRQKEWRDRKKNEASGNATVTGESESLLHNGNVTITLPSRNAATRPDQTRPNQTAHNQKDLTDKGGVGETKPVPESVVASWEKILGVELPQGNTTADWLREYFALHPGDVMPVAAILRRKRDAGGVETPLDYLFGIAQKRAGRRANGEPLERESNAPSRASPSVPIENVVVPASQSRYRPL